jgi:hypothetical protein
MRIINNNYSASERNLLLRVFKPIWLVLQEEDLGGVCVRPIVQNLALPDSSSAAQDTNTLCAVGSELV